jgi:hypothetical protein
MDSDKACSCYGDVACDLGFNTITSPTPWCRDDLNFYYGIGGGAWWISLFWHRTDWLRADLTLHIYTTVVLIQLLNTVSGIIGITGSHSHNCVFPTSKIDHDDGQYQGAIPMSRATFAGNRRSTDSEGRTANRWSQSGNGVGYVTGGGGTAVAFAPSKKATTVSQRGGRCSSKYHP